MFSGDTDVVHLLASSEPFDQSIEPLHCGLRGETLQVVAATVNDCESTRPGRRCRSVGGQESWRLENYRNKSREYVLRFG